MKSNLLVGSLVFFIGIGACESHKNKTEELKMNQNIAKGYIKEFNGLIKQKYAEFTDDEIGKLEGKISALAGELQRKYGYAADKANEEANNLIKKLKEKVN